MFRPLREEELPILIELAERIKDDPGFMAFCVTAAYEAMAMDSVGLRMVVLTAYELGRMSVGQ